MSTRTEDVRAAVELLRDEVGQLAQYAIDLEANLDRAAARAQSVGQASAVTDLRKALKLVNAARRKFDARHAEIERIL